MQFLCLECHTSFPNTQTPPSFFYPSLIFEPEWHLSLLWIRKLSIAFPLTAISQSTWNICACVLFYLLACKLIESRGCGLESSAVPIHTPLQSSSSHTCHVTEFPTELVKTDYWTSTPQVFESVGQERGLRTGMSNQFSGDAGTAGLEPQFEIYWHRESKSF